MTSTAILEISLLPDPERAVIAGVYRTLADQNRLYFAQTGTDLYRQLADYAERRANETESGVSLLFDVEAEPCSA